MSYNNLVKQFPRYLCVGILAYLLDVASYILFRNLSYLSIFESNLIARLLGAAFAFYLNLNWTFINHDSKKSETNNIYFLSAISGWRYIALWIINTTISSTILIEYFFIKTTNNEFFYKAIVEFFLVLSNFMICKLWVYKHD